MSIDPATIQATEIVAKEAGETVRHMLDNFWKEPSEELGGLFADQIKFWRSKNLIRINQKLIQFLEKNNISPTAQLNFVIPLLESSGNVEDETLANMFASLLASHLNPETQDSTHLSFLKIISQITPVQKYSTFYILMKTRTLFTILYHKDIRKFISPHVN